MAKNVITQIKEKQSDDSYIAYPIGTMGQYVLVDYGDEIITLQASIDKINESLNDDVLLEWESL